MDEDKIREGQQRKKDIYDLQAAEDLVERLIKVLYTYEGAKVDDLHNAFFRYKTCVHKIIHT